MTMSVIPVAFMTAVTWIRYGYKCKARLCRLIKNDS